MLAAVASAVAEPLFQLAVFPEDGLPRVESFDTLDALAIRIRELDSHDVTAFPFFGYRLGISKPPLRYLVTPWGNQPLFDSPSENLELEDDGFLGKRQPILQVPDTAEEEDLPAPTAPTPAEHIEAEVNSAQSDIFSNLDADDTLAEP